MAHRYPILHKIAYNLAQTIAYDEMYGRITHAEHLRRLAILNGNYNEAQAMLQQFYRLIERA